MLTTALDLIGALLIILAVAVFVWPWSVAGALALAGVGVLAVGALILLWLEARGGGPAVPAAATVPIDRRR